MAAAQETAETLSAGSHAKTGTPGSPTVFVVDDDPATCEWIRGVAESVGYNVNTFTSAQLFLDTYEEGQRGCLLLDVRMPRISGLDLQTQMRESHIEIPIVMMSAFGEVGVAVRAMKAGALDFLEKPCSAQDLLDRINRAVNEDQKRAAERIAKRGARQRLDGLTVREVEVLDGILAGHPNKVIASDLGISEKTVEVRRSNLMQKMGAGSVAELIKLALLARS